MKKSKKQMKAIHAKKRRKMIEKNIDGSKAKAFFSKNESLF